MRLEFGKVKALIDQHHRFVLTTHINPDGDGLGCEIGLASFLKQKGKQVSILNHSITPWNYKFLDPNEQIQQFHPATHANLVADADVIFVLDTNSPHRLASLKEDVQKSKACKICIDHHLDKVDFADLYLIDEASAATGQIIYTLCNYLDSSLINEEMATALYVAIMTDTGSFRFPKTDSELHRMIAHLIERGADPVATYQQVYEQSSAQRLQLLGKALAGLGTLRQNKVAYLTVSWEMFRETGTEEADTDNFVTYTLLIQGVQIGLLFTELLDGVKISFRSKGDIEINKLAQEFGGNGHKNAAGAHVTNTRLSDILPAVLERAQDYTT